MYTYMGTTAKNVSTSVNIIYIYIYTYEMPRRTNNRSTVLWIQKAHYAIYILMQEDNRDSMRIITGKWKEKILIQILKIIEGY